MKIFMVAYYWCHRKLQFLLKFLVLPNVFWNNFMLSRTKCLLNNKSLLNPLLTFICHFFEWRSSIPILGTWLSFWAKWLQLNSNPELNFNTQPFDHQVSLVKRLRVRLRTKWFWVQVQLQSLTLQISCLLRARSSLTLRQL